MDANFEEVESLVPGPGVDETELFEELFVGCECLGAVCDSSCTCLQYTKSEMNYDVDGRVAFPDIGSIVECSDSCACALLPRSCGNRVVQERIKVKLEVQQFPGKGNGVVAEEMIAKNSFVCEYAGELISAEEEQRRAKTSRSSPHNYTFTIKEHLQSGTRTSYIDARHRSNIARFINHSCDPNLTPCIVRFNSEAPHVALFARRQIKKGEELCYDYGPSEKSSVEGGSGSYSEPEQRKACCCGAENCRGYLPVGEAAVA
ncbi:hypothetical protein L596_004654 [Steinernema carpocapsae]|uniref:Histone-lysine N-methyltransferase n=1 Tax=Steinernema carpocapsae TaxID=34508 RepID=A0A4U8UXZ6_STECR|nr:hypothetical protein L596_004654 [Steinernema carpocapsae]